MASDERECLMQLPLAERTVAVALKHVFDEIKKIEDQQMKQIQQVHQSFIGKFKEVELKSSDIIKGKAITEADLKDKNKYFSNEELAQVDSLAKNHKAIKDYWLVVMENFFPDELSPSDKEIAKAILDISSNITEERLELSVELTGNPWIKQGKISREFILQDGQPTKVEGDKAVWLKKRPEGVLTKILDGGRNQQELLEIFPLVGDIINDLVPYSLQFFMGVVEEQVIDVDDQNDDEEEEMEEDPEDDGPQKKVKE